MKEKINLKTLEEHFKEALAQKAKYVAVSLKIDGYKENEIIISPYENIIDKLTYYKEAYNENLTLKNNENVKITNFVFANTFEDIKDFLKYGL